MSDTATPSVSDAETVDVVIVGAGISGVGAACHLSTQRPGSSYVVLERRQAIGGTWDLFRYPGVRSDSDMMTFGFNFRPWRDTRVLADGASIREYVTDTAREFGVTDHIRFGVRVRRASWSGDAGTWTVEAVDEADGTERTFRARFLIACTGYYDYDGGFRPSFRGEDRFEGTFVHPQFWPDDLDHAGKKVLIVGSGATAVTLVPAMAGVAEHVTMLQRSPSYIMSLPDRDPIYGVLSRVLPGKLGYTLTRGRNIAIQRLMYVMARKQPKLAKALLRRLTTGQLGDGEVDIKHFTPSYDPWDQRLCFVPHGDLFSALRRNDADVVTGTIRTFTEHGVELESGESIDADIVVTATGLSVQMLGGADLVVDGEPVDLHDRLTYKAVLVEGVPNAALIFGYINASWTLKADIAAEYVCRLLDHMDEHGFTTVVAHAEAGDRTADSVLSALNSGYVRRGDAALPRQGTAGPWRVTNDYLRDAPMLRRAPIDDPDLAFSRGALASREWTTPAPSVA